MIIYIHIYMCIILDGWLAKLFEQVGDLCNGYLFPSTYILPYTTESPSNS